MNKTLLAILIAGLTITSIGHAQGTSAKHKHDDHKSSTNHGHDDHQSDTKHNHDDHKSHDNNGHDNHKSDAEHNHEDSHGDHKSDGGHGHDSHKSDDKHKYGNHKSGVSLKGDENLLASIGLETNTFKDLLQQSGRLHTATILAISSAN
ncbi:MAG: hypothetical protein ACRBCI_00995 [Cellvibrionaceae bacterium]